MNKLEIYRQKIDDLDNQIQDLLQERFELLDQISSCKIDGQYKDTNREKKITSRLEARRKVTSPHYKNLETGIMEIIFQNSIAYMKSKQ